MGQLTFKCNLPLFTPLTSPQNSTFTFNNLADACIQSDVQMRTIEAIRPLRVQQYTSAMTSLS